MGITADFLEQRIERNWLRVTNKKEKEQLIQIKLLLYRFISACNHIEKTPNSLGRNRSDYINNQGLDFDYPIDNQPNRPLVYKSAFSELCEVLEAIEKFKHKDCDAFVQEAKSVIDQLGEYIYQQDNSIVK